MARRDDHHEPHRVAVPRGPAANAVTHVVGVGGSAGSLQPLQELLRGLSAPPNASFVVVTHRRSDEESMIVEILGRATSMPVREVSHGVALEGGVVYVVPTDKLVAIRGGAFELRDVAADGRGGGGIDAMLRVVADAFGERSVGVLLSGMGSDGTVGLGAIKEGLGLALVQTPASAEYDAMPASAVSSGVADFSGTPKELADYLRGFLELVARRAPATVRDSGVESEHMTAILAAVRAHTGYDFSQYKRSTLERRVERRLDLCRVRTLASYVELLGSDPEEVDRLFRDLLIGVTRFFRDAQTFDALKDTLPVLLENRPARPFRAWIAGCATGEEAYSLAITIREAWEARHPKAALDVQIYATDLDSHAIERARQGTYGPDIAADVSPARLARWFVEDAGRYRVKKTIRDMLVFATHNIISDPPFTRLDLLSCRNVLIYLDLPLQRKVLPLFAHALVSGGLLLLGTSEGSSGLGDEFVPVGSGLKLFRRRGEPLRGHTVFPLDAGHAPLAIPPDRATGVGRSEPLADLVQREISSRLSIPAIVVDAKGELLFASQRIGRYLELPVGRATVNVLAMAREGLAIPLRSALQRALSQKNAKSVRVRAEVRGIPVDLHAWALSLREHPRATAIAFVEGPRAEKKGSAKRRAKGKADPQVVAQLRHAKAQLATLMADTTASQEALQSLNEELQSANEELQSTNEELTTSKEEMQSMNEELLSLNAELQTKNELLAVANDDMRNLLDSSQIPTLFLDGELRLKRFTEQASRIARLIPSDIGRPITDLAWSLPRVDLPADVREVLRTLVFKEAEVTTDDGRVYMMRIHPYRTIDDVIDGVVITFLDVTIQKAAAARLAASEKAAVLVSLVTCWPGLAYVEEIATGRTTVVSRRAEKHLGYPLAVLTNATALFWRTLRGERTSAPPRPVGITTKKVTLRRSDGDLLLYVERCSPLGADGDTMPTHLLHVFRRRADTSKGEGAGDGGEGRRAADAAPRRARPASRRARDPK